MLFRSEACVVNINVEGNEYQAILQASQYHKLTDKLIHADFLELQEGKPATMQIPVKLHGQAQGVKDGGQLALNLRKLKVTGLISKIPQYIDINIENLKIGKSVTPSDIKLEGVTLNHPSNISIVSVLTTRKAVEEEKPAAATPAAAAAPAAAAPAAAAPKK